MARKVERTLVDIPVPANVREFAYFVYEHEHQVILDRIPFSGREFLICRHEPSYARPNAVYVCSCNDLEWACRVARAMNGQDDDDFAAFLAGEATQAQLFP